MLLKRAATTENQRTSRCVHEFYSMQLSGYLTFLLIWRNWGAVGKYAVTLKYEFTFKSSFWGRIILKIRQIYFRLYIYENNVGISSLSNHIWPLIVCRANLILYGLLHKKLLHLSGHPISAIRQSFLVWILWRWFNFLGCQRFHGSQTNSFNHDNAKKCDMIVFLIHFYVCIFEASEDWRRK